jgi:hypothetical protein
MIAWIKQMRQASARKARIEELTGMIAVLDRIQQHSHTITGRGWEAKKAMLDELAGLRGGKV